MRTIHLHTRKPEWQSLVALVDDEDFDRVNQHRWNLKEGSRGTLYAQTKINGVTVLMHRFILRASPSDPQVDHVDHNGLHNWRLNIRFASYSQNHTNSRPRLGGTSQYKGVSLDSRNGKWQARSVFQGIQAHLGLFDTELEAALAYNQFALKHHGEFAKINDFT